MPFREKIAWTSFVTTLLVWGYYFLALVRELATGDPEGSRFIGLAVGCTIAIVLLQVVATIVLAIHAPRDAESYPTSPDERERLIEYRATRNAFFVLNLLAVSAAIATPFLAVAGPILLPQPAEDGMLLIGSAILFAIVAAELVRSGSQIFYFHR
jgi:hypothetical protein